MSDLDSYKKAQAISEEECLRHVETGDLGFRVTTNHGGCEEAGLRQD